MMLQTEITTNIINALNTDQSINIAIVEDDESQIQIYKDAIDEVNLEWTNLVLNAHFLKNDSGLNEIILCNRLDAIIIDLNLGSSNEDDSGNDIIEKIYMYKRIPIFVVSGNLNRLRERRENTAIYREYNRSDIDCYKLFSEIKKIYLSGYTKIFGHPGKIDNLLNQVFWKYASCNIDTWYNDEENDLRDRRFMRFVTARMNEQLHYNGNSHDLYNSIEFYINPPNSSNYFNGDIIFLYNKYYLVMTPSCAIENNNCDNIMLCEIDFELFRQLKVKLKQNLSNTNKQKLKDLINNKNKDIHFLPPTVFFEGAIVDFSKKLEIKKEEFEENKSLKYRISQIFMKDIINRFSLYLRNNNLEELSNYYSKQGQPEIDIDEIINIINKEESN